MRVAGIPLGVGQNTLNPSSSTLALLHFDGANGSTTFTDSSANNVTITTNGTAQLSTGTKSSELPLCICLTTQHIARYQKQLRIFQVTIFVLSVLYIP